MNKYINLFFYKIYNAVYWRRDAIIFLITIIIIIAIWCLVEFLSNFTAWIFWAFIFILETIFYFLNDSTPDLPIHMFMDGGESSKNPNNSNNEPVITDLDFEWYSSPSHSNDNDDDDNEEDISKIINSNIDKFEENIKKLSNEELAEILNSIEDMKNRYANDNVPSSKEQIGILEKKEESCANQLSANMSKEENIENKENKEVNKENYKGKGKSKE